METISMPRASQRACASEQPQRRLSISAIIPTWCEAKHVVDAVRMASSIADDVIVADAGSPDGTAALAAEAGARVVRAPKGRGAQLDVGARAATSDVLLFLHADAWLPPEARQAIEAALASSQVAGGNFRISFGSGTHVKRIFNDAYNLRSKWLRIYYGDSAVFVRGTTYAELGGFRPLLFSLGMSAHALSRFYADVRDA